MQQNRKKITDFKCGASWTVEKFVSHFIRDDVIIWIRFLNYFPLCAGNPPVTRIWPSRTGDNCHGRKKKRGGGGGGGVKILCLGKRGLKLSLARVRKWWCATVWILSSLVVLHEKHRHTYVICLKSNYVSDVMVMRYSLNFVIFSGFAWEAQAYIRHLF